MRKPAFRVSNQVIPKPACSVTENTFQLANNKGTDQTVWMCRLSTDQAVQMRRLECAFVVHKPEDRVSRIEA